MSSIDPVIRRAAIKALGLVQRQLGSIPGNHITRIANAYDLSPSTVRSWARVLEAGKSPNLSRRAPATQWDEILVAVVHYGNLRNAHRHCRAAGLYDKSYAQFCKDFKRDLPPGVRQGLLLGSWTTLPMPMMRYPKVFRNQVWVLDHTPSDVRTVDHKGNVHRRWVSILKDKATRVILGIQFTEEHSTSARVISLISEAMLGNVPIPHEYGFVGGRPESIQVDNGAENTAEHVVTGLARLGIALSLTTPGHSWENGSAENIIGHYQGDFERRQPGFVRAGLSTEKQLRFVSRTYDTQDTDDLLTDETLEIRARQWALHYNTQPGSDGDSPLGLWLQETNHIDHVELDEIRWAMTVSERNYSVTKNGIHFRNREYQAACLAPYIGRGKVVTVRSFPGVKDWIDVWHGDTHVGRAHLIDALPVAEQSRIMAHRRSQLKAVHRAEAQALRIRQQDAESSDQQEESNQAPIPTEIFGVDAKPVRDRRTRRPKRTGGERRKTARTDAAAQLARTTFQPLPLDTPGKGTGA